jgi:hypothetical protein
MLPSTNQLLHTAVTAHFYDIMSRFPSPHAPGFAPPTEPPYRLGEYLVDLGYLSPHELAAALHSRPAHPTIPLGCRLVARNLVPAQVVAMALLLEWLDRWEHEPRVPPHTRAEQLLDDALLSVEQVALAITEQLLAYDQGTWIDLDTLLIRHGWCSQPAPAAEVEELAH